MEMIFVQNNFIYKNYICAWLLIIAKLKEYTETKCTVHQPLLIPFLSTMFAEKRAVQKQKILQPPFF